MRMIRYRRFDQPSGWLHFFAVPNSDVRVLAHGGFVEVMHGSGEDESVWRIANALPTAHAEAVAADLAAWLVSTEPIEGVVLWRRWAIYDAEEAVERLQPGSVACEKLLEPPKQMVEEHFQQAWREAEEASEWGE